MNENFQNATDYVATWIASHRSEIGGTQYKFVRDETYGRKLCAEFDTTEHLIQFCAWDHACCLDIIALNKNTGCDAYVVAGECDGATGLSDRLNGFLSWLDANDPNRTA